MSRWKVGVMSRLPQHYYKHRVELAKTPSPVHYIPETERFKMNPKTGEVTRHETCPIPLMFNKKMNEGIWGGEMIIKGFTKKKPLVRRNPHFWIPSLKLTTVYSEILNEYMKIVVTNRTLDLIDAHYGFDSYILKTPVQDLKSQLALDIRRKLLLTLIKKDFCTDDLVKQAKLLKKYKDCIIPKEEAEWFGLSLKAACDKLLRQEDEKRIPIPLKPQFRAQLFEELKQNVNQEPKETSWLSKINPFQKIEKNVD